LDGRGQRPFTLCEDKGKENCLTPGNKALSIYKAEGGGTRKWWREKNCNFLRLKNKSGGKGNVLTIRKQGGEDEGCLKKPEKRREYHRENKAWGGGTSQDQKGPLGVEIERGRGRHEILEKKAGAGKTNPTTRRNPKDLPQKTYES